jgi:hypothetical protein
MLTLCLCYIKHSCWSLQHINTRAMCVLHVCIGVYTMGGLDVSVRQQLVDQKCTTQAATYMNCTTQLARTNILRTLKYLKH